jgi:hypothetical protein
MVGAEHRAQRLDPLAAAGHALLVEVVAEHIHAIGAAQVVEDVAIQVGHGDAGRGLEEGTALQVLAQETAVLERARGRRW